MATGARGCQMSPKPGSARPEDGLDAVGLCVLARRTSSRRPFALAVVVSVALHAALLMRFPNGISTLGESSTSNTVLVFSFDTEGTARPGSPPAEWRLDGEAASAQDIVGEDPTAERPLVIEDPDEDTGPLVSRPREGFDGEVPQSADRDDTVDEDGTDQRQVDLPDSEAPPTDETTATVAPASADAAEPMRSDEDQTEARISRRQERMLRRRVGQWSEDLPEPSEQGASVAWRHEGRDYVAKFTWQPVNPDVGLERVHVEVSTEHEGARLSTGMDMTRLSFSSYAQFVNRWDPRVRLHDDELEGRFHSNTEISLFFNREAIPRFRGKVTTAAHDVSVTGDPRYFAREDVFLGGLETGVRPIGLASYRATLPDEGNGQVHVFENDARIRFHADGSYSWQELASPGTEKLGYLRDGTGYLIASRDARLHVRGTVNGKVLVYSPERIVIEGDLVYADDPLSNPGSDDLLGLVSDKVVEIAAPDVTGVGDLVIQAAIYAKRRFVVRNTGRAAEARLVIFGSLTSDSMSATEPRYATRIRFDPRLERLRPPRFPMTDRYEVMSWDKTWSVSEAGGPS